MLISQHLYQFFLNYHFCCLHVRVFYLPFEQVYSASAGFLDYLYFIIFSSQCCCVLIDGIMKTIFNNENNLFIYKWYKSIHKYTTIAIFTIRPTGMGPFFVIPCWSAILKQLRRRLIMRWWIRSGKTVSIIHNPTTSTVALDRTPSCHH